MTGYPPSASLLAPRELPPPAGLSLHARTVAESAQAALAVAAGHLAQGYLPRTYPATEDEDDFRWVAEAWDWDGRDRFHPGA